MKKGFKVFGIGLVLLSFLSVVYAQEFQQNLLFNYDFGAIDTATSTPAAWDVEDPSQVENKIVTWDGDVGHNTYGSLKIATWDPVVSKVSYAEVIETKPGSTLNFEIWIKTELVRGNGARAKIVYVNDDQEIGERTIDYLSGTNSWKKFSITDEVPEGTTGIRVILEFDGQGIAWYDDALLVLQ